MVVGARMVVALGIGGGVGGWVTACTKGDGFSGLWLQGVWSKLDQLRRRRNRRTRRGGGDGGGSSSSSS
jgi:hypothetical protein